MNKKEIKNLFEVFENTSYHYQGIECWSARELQQLLGYRQWRNFENIILKAKESCRNTGEDISYHFADVSKTIEMPKGAKKEIHDMLLTRYASYLVAQNGDSSKLQIAFAQSYFALQTQIAELIEQRLLESERIKARKKLQETEKHLSAILYERGVNENGFGIIRSKGDQALFRLNTTELKRKMNVPQDRPLADFLPTISIKAKDFSAAMTAENIEIKKLSKLSSFEKEHVENNLAVRKIMIERGLVPENLPPSEDIKKVERRIASDVKKVLKNKTNKK